MSLLRRGIISSGKLGGGGIIEYSANTADLNGTNQYFSASDSADFTLTATSWTMAFNVKFDSLSNSPTFYNQRDDGSNFTDIRISTAGAIQLTIFHSGLNVISLNTAASTITTGVWYNIVYMRSGSTITCYLDDSSVASGSIVNSLTDLTTDIVLGRWQGGGNYIDGSLGPFGLWNSIALSGALRTELYNLGDPQCYDSMSPSLKTGLSVFSELAEWSGHAGQALTDQTGNGNTWTNNNSIGFTGSGISVFC